MPKKKSIKFFNFKRSNVKTFGFFLIFSTIIWVFVQFSKKYSETIQIPIVYVNAPLDKSIAQEKPNKVNLLVKETGFSILWDYTLFKPSLQVDLSMAEVHGNELVYTIEEHRTQIEQQMNVDFDNASFETRQISVNFQARKEKMIKVVPQFSLTYAVGFSAGNPISIQPDSVKISGPETMLDTLESVSTLPLKLNNINTNINGEVGIDTTNLGRLGFYTTKVAYSQKVEKFTEGQVEVSIEVLNLPPETKLSIFPHEVRIYYQVNLEDYDSVKSSDFRVVCDYNDIGANVEYLIAEVVQKPRFVTNVRLNERKIQFIIKK